MASLTPHGFRFSDVPTRFGGRSDFSFGVSMSERGSVATLELSGEFDVASSDRFDAYMRHLLSADPDHLVIDLRGLSFIDSSGLQLLVRAYALARENGFRLWLVCADGQVRQALEISGIAELLPPAQAPPDLPG
jgi:anti-anti-sigma factor